jgi:hypothetical protein
MSKLQWSITAHVICVTTKNRPRLKLLFKVKLGLDMARIICIELANFRLFFTYDHGNTQNPFGS